MVLRNGQAAEPLAMANRAGTSWVGGHGQQTKGLHLLYQGCTNNVRVPEEGHLLPAIRVGCCNPVLCSQAVHIDCPYFFLVFL